MIDNNIIQSLGVGSGIDTNNLVKQLTEIERAAPQERIDSKRELAETQISDFGLLTSALSTLQDAAEALTDPEALFSKSASFTESDALVPTSLDTDVPAGTYAFTVDQVAQAQSLAFTGFSDPTDAVGEGTLTFNFGEWERDGNGDIDTGAGTPFVQDTEHESTTITIDSSNNSLNGLRDAINAADFGVSATVVFDGTDYHLALLATSGNENQLEIVASEDGGSPTNTDSSDLSRFAFNTDITSYEALETQGGQDAIVTINGLSVNRSSNTIDDIVDGLTLDILAETEVGETVTVTVSDDKEFAEQNIRTFVDSFNAFLEAVDPIFGTREEEDEDGDTEIIQGSLANDGLAKSVISQIRALVASSVTGLSDDAVFTSLTNIGIRTELDGTLSIDEDDFESAFDDNFEDIQKLLAPLTISDSEDITINSYNDNTQPGEYDIVVTQAPSQGLYEGSAFAGISFPLDTSTKTYTFIAEVNGTTSGTITIPSDTYADESALAGAIQTAINTDSELDEAGISVTVAYDSDSGGLDITTNAYGDSTNFNITTTSDDSRDELGLIVQDGTAGDTAAGTVDGTAGFGSANVLLPTLGEDGEGLALVLGNSATSATVNFSLGFAGELERLIDNFLDSDGPIALREDTLDDTIDGLDEDEEDLDRRISSYEERLIQQYIAMERIIGSLNSSGSFLDNLINTLPFTANNK
ncbi:MAG: flagellar filament capping protein FliD [Agarilytica sp.]